VVRYDPPKPAGSGGGGEFVPATLGGDVTAMGVHAATRGFTWQLGTAAHPDSAAGSGGGLAGMLTLTVAELASPSVLTGSVHLHSSSRRQLLSAWVRLPAALVDIYKRELPYNDPFWPGPDSFDLPDVSCELELHATVSANTPIRISNLQTRALYSLKSRRAARRRRRSSARSVVAARSS
jgi:hypothetical protein